MEEKELANLVASNVPSTGMYSFLTIYSTHIEVCVYNERKERISEINLKKKVLSSAEEIDKEHLLLQFYLPHLIKAGILCTGDGFVKM